MLEKGNKLVCSDEKCGNIMNKPQQEETEEKKKDVKKSTESKGA
jgi:predicted nucleic acid-binding Zn ribbon protein